MADGTLKFDTKIDMSGVDQGAKTLKETLNSLINSIDSLAKTVDIAINSIGFDKVNSGLQQVAQSADTAKANTEELGTGASGAMAQAEMSAEELEKAMDAITITRWDNVDGSIDQVAESINETAMGAKEAATALDHVADNVPAELNEASNAGNQFKSTLEFIKQTARDIPGVFAQVGANVKGAFDGVDTTRANTKIQNLVSELDRYKDRLASLESQGYYFGDREYDETYRKAQKMTQQLNEYKKSLTQTDVAQKKVSSSAKKTGKSMDGMNHSAGGLGKTLNLLKTSLLIGLAFQAMMGAVTAVKEGFQNLVQYSSSANTTLSALMTSLLTLKNAFATAFNPILTAITPALQTLINYLVQAITTVGQFFAVFLNGATTFTKAKDAQIDYAKSLDKSAKSAQDLNNALSPIDKLNVVSDPAAGGAGSAGTPGMPDPSTMFEEVPIDSKFIDSINKLKETLSTLFEPIKNAWDTYGKPTMDALQYAAGSIKDSFALIGQSFAEIWLNGSGETLIGNILQLLITVLNLVGDIGKAFQTAWTSNGTGDAFLQSIFDLLNSILELLRSVGESFRDAWNSGTGEKIITNILQIFTNINTTIKNIADNFKKAWIKDNTGTKIIQDILNMFNDVLGAINNISKATSDWAKGLDFTPILTAFQNLTSSLEPLIGTISDGLAWFYENVLLPIAGWVITDVAPLFFDGLAAALDLVNGVIEALQPLGIWLFDNFLKPIAEWTGGVITDVLGFIVDKLQAFADWISKNQKAVENIAIVIGSFVAAWGIVNLAVLIGGIVTALAAFVLTGGLASTIAGGLALVIGFITSPVTLVVVAIGALIAIGVLLYKNWDVVKAKATEIWGAIKDWFKKTLENIGKFFSVLWDSIKGFFGSIGTWFKERFTEAVTGIKSAFSAVGSWFKARYTDVTGAFASIGQWFKDIFSTAYTGIKNAFTPIKEFFKTLFNSLIDIVKSPINAIIGIINGMIGGIVSGINAVIRAINSINFTLPDWVPGIGGKGIGFNLREFTAPKIPKLATGTVVPANYGNFLATLGDNKREPEIVSPLSTMKQAFKEAMQESGGVNAGGMLHVTVMLPNRKVLFDEVVQAEKENYKSTGDPIFTH